MQKIDQSRWRFRKLPTAFAIVALLLLLITLVSFPVKAERWSTPIQVTFDMNIADDWGGPSISGDGSRIVFQHKVDGYYQVFVVNSDGTGLTQVTNNTLRETQLSINYDGSKIAFASYMQGSNADIFVVNSDGSGLQQITQSAKTDYYPSISNDGSKISFISFEVNVNGEIFVSLDLDQDSEAPVTVDDYDGQWHILDFQINLAATDDLSGVAETYYKLNDGSAKTVAAHGQPSITEEGADNTLEYWSVDVAGNEERHRVLTGIKLDKTAPTGSVIINNEDNSTSSPSVTLALSANDSSGVAQMRFSSNGTDWTSWETYATSKNWTLSSGDGEKTVYVQFKDTAGWVSDSYSDTILLDTVKASAFPIAFVIAGVTGVVVVAVVLLYIKKMKVTH